eukprot:scaffold4893_cov153-Pinguiococcus_pyrenoidosus.AAC.2
MLSPAFAKNAPAGDGMSVSAESLLLRNLVIVNLPASATRSVSQGPTVAALQHSCSSPPYIQTELF